VSFFFVESQRQHRQFNEKEILRKRNETKLSSKVEHISGLHKKMETIFQKKEGSLSFFEFPQLIGLEKKEKTVSLISQLPKIFPSIIDTQREST